MTWTSTRTIRGQNIEVSDDRDISLAVRACRGSRGGALVTADEREESKWDQCHRTIGCIYREGHGSQCQLRQLVSIGPAQVYAYALQVGLDMIEELQRGRS